MENPSKLPVFPLSMAIFPGHTLPLKIFESRYFSMIKDCEKLPRKEFVISLISSGYEVGENATPYRVGTLVQYSNYMESNDLIFVSPIGYKRVYLDKFYREEKPYLSADILNYSDHPEETPATEKEIETLEKKLSQMWIAGGTVHSKEAYSKLLVKKNELSQENYTLYLAGCLEIPQFHRQNLLESRSESYRIRSLLHLLSSKLKTEG